MKAILSKGPKLTYATASIQNEDDYLDLVSAKGGKRTCLLAAKHLERLARVFRRLAEEDGIYKESVQEALNNRIPLVEEEQSWF
jgi:hypothetical protein